MSSPDLPGKDESRLVAVVGPSLTLGALTVLVVFELPATAGCGDSQTLSIVQCPL